MNNTDKQYFDLLSKVLNEGRLKKNRTGTNTLGIFGAQARFDLQEGFPILTTKKVSFHNIKHELFWFLSGSTNIKYLVDNNVNIWNADCYKKYLSTQMIDLNHQHFFKGEWNKDGCVKPVRHFTMEEFVEEIKKSQSEYKLNGGNFAAEWGDLGEGAYGSMWRSFPYAVEDALGLDGSRELELRYVDQISKLVYGLKNNPDSRRHIVTAWHPYLVDTVVLPPCHCFIQFHTEELTESERREEGINNCQKYTLPHTDDPYECLIQYDHDQLDSCEIPRRRLNCQLYQRSADIFLGIPYNVSSYALLTNMIAQCVNMVPGDFVHTFGDLYLYENHKKQAYEQLYRDPRELPKLVLNPKVKNIFDFKAEDITLEGYNPHPAIKADICV